MGTNAIQGFNTAATLVNMAAAATERVTDSTKDGKIDFGDYPVLFHQLRAGDPSGLLSLGPSGSRAYIAYSEAGVTYTEISGTSIPLDNSALQQTYITVSDAIQALGPVHVRAFTVGGDGAADVIIGNWKMYHIGNDLGGSWTWQIRFHDGQTAVLTSAVTEWFNTHQRTKIDLQYFAQFYALFQATGAGAGTAKAAIQYSADGGSTWDYLSGGSGVWTTLVNGSNEISATATIIAAARTDVLLRVVVKDGNDSTSLSIYGSFFFIARGDATRKIINYHNAFQTTDFTADGGCKWVNMPASDTPMPLDPLASPTNQGTMAQYLPLAKCTRIRISADVMTAGATNAKFTLKYPRQVDGAYVPFSGLEPKITIGTTGIKTSDWVTIPVEARRDDVIVNLYGEGGDASADPVWNGLQIETTGAEETPSVPPPSPPPIPPVKRTATGKLFLEKFKIKKELSKLTPRNNFNFTWTQHGTYTNTWYCDFNLKVRGIRRALEEVSFRGRVYRFENNHATCNATIASWCYIPLNATDIRLIVHPDEDSGDPLDLNAVIGMADFSLYYANQPYQIAGEFWMPELAQEDDSSTNHLGVTDHYFAQSAGGGGESRLVNGAAEYDYIGWYYWWINGRVTQYLGNLGAVTLKDLQQIRHAWIQSISRSDTIFTVTFDSLFKKMEDISVLQELLTKTTFPNLPDDNVGTYQGMFFGEVNIASGTTEEKAERSVKAVLVSPGTEHTIDHTFTDSVWKIVAKVKNPYTGYVHMPKLAGTGPDTHKAVYYTDPVKDTQKGWAVTTNYTLTAGDSTLLTLHDKIAASGSVAVACYGYQDDDDGTFTGTANAVIEQAPDIMQFLMNTRGGIKPNEILKDSFTMQGVTTKPNSESGDGTVEALSWIGTMNMPLAPEKPEGYLPRQHRSHGGAKVLDELSRLCVSMRAAIQENNEGLIELVPIKNAVTAEDIRLIDPGLADMEETLSLDQMVSAVIVEYDVNPGTGKRNQVVSKTLNTVAALSDVLNDDEDASGIRWSTYEAITGQTKTENVQTYVRTSAVAQELADSYFHSFRNGLLWRKLRDVMGLSITEELGVIILIQKLRALGGPVKELPLHMADFNRRILPGIVDHGKLYEFNGITGVRTKRGTSAA